MSEEQTQQEAPAEEAKAPEATEQAAETSNSVKLNGGFAFKVGMSQIYDEKGEIVPVTVLRWEPWVVSQIKTQDIKGIFNKDDKSEQELLMKNIRELEKHTSLYIDGEKQIKRIKDKAFWELLNDA